MKAHYRDTLWVALSAAVRSSVGVSAEDWISGLRRDGSSWREIETLCAQHSVPVSHEWLRSQAKSRGLDRKVA